MSSTQHLARKAISPREVARAAATASSRQSIYVDYLIWLPEAGARRVLIGLALSVLVLEGLARVKDPAYPRTAISSLHGVRAIAQQVLDDPGPKALAFGDSTLLGGGVSDPNRTVLGLFVNASADCNLGRTYNLAVPGGDSTTSALLFEGLARQNLSNVKTVYIESFPSKFINWAGAKVNPSTVAEESQNELQHYLPILNPEGMGLPRAKMDLSQRVEVKAEWYLGEISRFYRHRDLARTEVMGNYPVFWAIGALTPPAIRMKVVGRGTNRLGANLEDFPFIPEDRKKVPGGRPRLAAQDQERYLRLIVRQAHKIGAKPVLLAFPTHTAYLELNPEQERQLQEALDGYEKLMVRIAHEEHAELLLVPSRDFQDPSLWTRTVAHFNRAGSQKIWQLLRPRWCAIAGCKCASSTAP